MATGSPHGYDPAWADRPPSAGEAGYAAHQAYLAYEEQQIAYWAAYSIADAPTGGLLPNLNGSRTDAGLLYEIERCAQRENAAAGAKLRAVADYAFRKMADPVVGYDQEHMKRSVEAEVAVKLKLPPSAASEMLGLALMLAKRLPRTFDALERGELTKPAAELIADESANLDVAQCARLEDEVLPDAAQRSYRSLRTKVRREVEKLDADAVRKRTEKAREERTLYVKDEHDGMATLCLTVPAQVAHGIYDAINDKVLTAQATLKRDGADAALVLPTRDDRPVGAQRADTTVDILAAGLGIDPWAPPVPVSSFLTDEQIASLDRGANTYVPSKALKAAVRNRDKHCRFPGCRRPARHCDLDHSIAFLKVGGRRVGPGTVYFNLGAVCRFHHQIKQLPGWHVEQDRGRFIWTTPQGIRFVVHPPPEDANAEPPDFGRYNPADDIPPY